MNNLGAYKDLFEIYSTDLQQNTKLIITLTIFIGINLLVTILNIISQQVLKTKDKKIFSFTIREKKRIKHFEYVYQKFDDLTFFDGRQNNDSFLSNIQGLQKYITHHKLYFNKKELTLMNDYSDYFTIILSDHRKKDFQLEFSHAEKLQKAFT
jgi:hypothetical protein